MLQLYALLTAVGIPTRCRRHCGSDCGYALRVIRDLGVLMIWGTFYRTALVGPTERALINSHSSCHRRICNLPLASLSIARTGTKGATSKMPGTCTCAVHSAARCQSHEWNAMCARSAGNDQPSRQHNQDDPDDRARRRGLSFSPREGGDDRPPRTGGATAVAMHETAAPSGKGSSLVAPVARSSCAL